MSDSQSTKLSPKPWSARLIGFLFKLDEFLLANTVLVYQSNRALSLQEKKLCGEDPGPVPRGVNTALLSQHIDREDTRRKSIEEKARTNLFALTIAATLIFTGLGVMTGQTTFSVFRNHLILPLILLVAVAYFVGAGIASVAILQIDIVYFPTLEQDAEYKGEAINELRAWCLQLNRFRTIRKANLASLSFNCLRNGVIFLLLFVVLTALYIFGGQEVTSRSRTCMARLTALSAQVCGMKDQVARPMIPANGGFRIGAPVCCTPVNQDLITAIPDLRRDGAQHCLISAHPALMSQRGMCLKVVKLPEL